MRSSSTRSIARRRAVAILTGVLIAVVVPSKAPSFAQENGASLRPFVLPIPPNQTWYVCQGYAGDVTHEGVIALDFSLAPSSAGSKGCMAGTKYSSAGSVVSSPGAGTAKRWPGCCGDDFICVNLDSGGSVAIGHLDNRVPDGTRVGTAERVGTVAWPNSSNGNYAHIHVQAHQDWDCTKGGDPVAFDTAHGFKWQCTPDLPYVGGDNQYSDLAVRRCPVPVSDDGNGPRATPDRDSRHRARERDRLGGESRLVVILGAMIEWLGGVAGGVTGATSR